MILWCHICMSCSSSLTKTKTIPFYTLCVLDKICLKIYLCAVKVYPRSCSCHQITCKQGDVYVRGEWKIEWFEFGFKLQTRSTMEFCPIVLAVWYVLKIYGSFFFSRKSWKYQIEREYGQIKKRRRCNEKKWKKRYSERRKVVEEGDFVYSWRRTVLSLPGDL